MVAGKEVKVESTKSDRYGRVLGKVWVQPADCPTCGKTLNTNHAQLLAGMAWWYRYYAKDQSPEDRGRYESAEDEAKARKWGCGLIQTRLIHMTGGRVCGNGGFVLGAVV
jgi:endonuclease YncB( thermonuclease family)